MQAIIRLSSPPLDCHGELLTASLIEFPFDGSIVILGAQRRPYTKIPLTVFIAAIVIRIGPLY